MIGDSLKSRSLRQSVDWSLIFCYMALFFIGWINVYASVHSSEPNSILDLSARSGKQFIWFLTSLGIGGIILFVLPSRLWENLSIPGYLIVLILLIAVIFLGVEVKGSRSWFQFGEIKFQPAEVSKISTSLLLAFIMSRDGFKLTQVKDFLCVALAIVIPMLIIVAEKETGSALVYVGFIFMLYREGLSGWFITAIGICILLFVLTLTNSPYTSILTLLTCITIFSAINSNKIWKWLTLGGIYLILMLLLPFTWDKIDPQSAIHFLKEIKPLYILIGSATLFIPYFIYRAFRHREHFLYVSILTFFAGIVLIFSTEFLFESVLQDHQRKRIEVLLGLKEDPAGVGYNVNQSMIAIGSGGFLGKGFLHGTQTTYGFVPEQTTDFIFCTVGEEWGFVGSAIVILLYVFLIIRIIIDAERSRESFTRIYGYCVASCIFMHLFINIGMTIGLVPVIGIPLPLISYGGSSLVTFTVLIFIFIALDHQEKKYF